VNRLRFTLALSWLVAVLHTPVSAETAGKPVGQGSGPVRDLSKNVGAGSGPVRGSVGPGAVNSAPLGGNSVRASVNGDVVSGPVSDITVGAVTSGRTVSGGGTVEQSSAGAVTKDIRSPLGEVISQPLRELGPLQARLRAIQPAPRTGPIPGEPSQPEIDTERSDAATTEQNDLGEQDDGDGGLVEPSGAFPAEPDGAAVLGQQPENHPQQTLEAPAAEPPVVEGKTEP
jgi:hypothetical protein